MHRSIHLLVRPQDSAVQQQPANKEITTKSLVVISPTKSPCGEQQQSNLHVRTDVTALM